ncbi:hypothetical protein [Amycolatopsis sp. NPDC051061]|uniref:hypothetical protein n=1 Tax=Amycolatopsis sp. NPDC051061 TaxID=3155042 RepID=UPI003426E8C7
MSRLSEQREDQRRRPGDRDGGPAAQPACLQQTSQRGGDRKRPAERFGSVRAGGSQLGGRPEAGYRGELGHRL